VDGQNPAQPVNGGYPPQQVAPVISIKDWMLTLLLMAIPLVNIIMLFVWAFGGGENPSKANYAKAALIWALIVIGLYVIFGVVIFGVMSSIR
jgi:succinate dehydrogenase/fumarate reductase cytochrome b subunit